MEEKYNLNSISKAFEKLFNAGFNTSKKIATLDIKEVRKIPNLTIDVSIDIWTHFMRGCIIDYVY